MVAVGDRSDLEHSHIDRKSLSGPSWTRATIALLSLQLVWGQGAVSFCIVRYFYLGKVAFETFFAACTNSKLYAAAPPRAGALTLLIRPSSGHAHRNLHRSHVG